VPLTSAWRYRATIRLTATLLSLTALPLGSAIFIPHDLTADHSRWFFIYGPSLIAAVYACCKSNRIAQLYIDVAPVALPMSLAPPANIYDAAFLRGLFDEMQTSYELVSNISSFGFNRRWRRQLTELIDLRPGMRIADLMAGGGETWMYVLPRISPAGELLAVDFSAVMAGSARERARKLQGHAIEVREEDALRSSIQPSSLDAVVCSYGVKTLSVADEELFVREVERVLRPGGVFGLVEVSVPENRLLRLPYLFYLGRVVPLIGILLLGNPANYRMLGNYTRRFERCRRLEAHFAASGFEVHYYSFFGGCASAVVGMKTRA
jgi:ubiquinone/menaquinone biosynthesis methyltransferase